MGDPVVASKIHFTKNTSDLEKYIPKELGGDDPFVYEYIEPKEGECDRLQDEATRNKMLQDRIQIYSGLEKTPLTGSSPPSRPRVLFCRSDLSSPRSCDLSTGRLILISELLPFSTVS